ncbi:MAG: amidohydrolase [Muricauda sp.]|nr:amidohydrolase [Allomuricauda sp.]MBO6589645.1 amidohydrolase [Allomuricauda sp.]MBO6619422.1 amidohydrolase [Allomuricauda sp.]MBO6645333.1 amidohydrolase [Allomuricauda sp.]MBO6747391.1 amidohydrolase [Allomuricauda sp.]MBO6844240.1 amidohydrolase [Allomuricauda sp.]
MKKFSTLLLLGLVSLNLSAQKMSKDKKAVVASVEKHKENLIQISDSIWALAETAFEESISSELLADYAEKNGMTVTRGVADIPTAFVATYGSGKPVISVLGEFDALPGLSQNTVPTKDPRIDGAPGHGCGHNMFGAASLGAAIAIKEQIEAGNIKGTVKFFGTPAEEKFFGKVWMVEAGLWDDVDVNVSWHPSAEIEADVQSGLALVDFMIEFYGQAAHASSDPWNGRSASDALELYTTGINYYREHIKPTSRIHYHIQDGGQVVNVVPDYARLWVRVRDPKRDVMLPTFERVKAMAEGAAIMANVDYKYSLISGIYETLVNREGGKIMQNNLELLGPITYTDEEITYGKAIQEATGKPQVGMDGEVHPLKETEELPGGGSTDVGDVSWNVPNINLGVTVAPKGTPWHSWAVVACGGMSIGHKGMIYASKAMGMTMFDLFDDQKLVEKVKEEFKTRKGDVKYEAMIDGPPPIPGK